MTHHLQQFTLLISNCDIIIPISERVVKTIIFFKTVDDYLKITYDLRLCSIYIIYLDNRYDYYI